MRETARRAQCQNNLKQISLGLLAFQQSQRDFPCGGWGHQWIGVADRGSGTRQPGGWIYSILPYVEERNLHDLGVGQSEAAATEAYSQRLRTAVPLFVCPTRRPCTAWPIADQFPWVRSPKPFGNVSTVGRADYAINGGTSHVFSFAGPASISEGDNLTFWQNAPRPKSFSGISHLRMAASISSIIDGTSKTYLVGEKYLEPANYMTGASPGDNESLYAGYCTDLHRFAGVVENLKLSRTPYALPLNDQSTPDSAIFGAARFGSAHPAGFHMAFGDGSIHLIMFDVDPDVHFRSAHRSDQGAPLASLD